MCLFFFFLANLINGFGQDRIIINADKKILNTSISNSFSYYIDTDNYFDLNDSSSFGAILKEHYPIKNQIENLDFTTNTYWIHFTLSNQSSKSLDLVFQTARPITNEVTLYERKSIGFDTLKSGDAIRFEEKNIHKSESLFSIHLGDKADKEYWLKLSSDGEIISLPMIFWEKEVFEKESQKTLFFGGMFYGVFFFVLLIYLTFYVFLKDRSFLLYVFYVLFSGMLQFSLDGYFHQYIFTSGGYWTQHIVLFSAGLTVVLLLQYARSYLQLATTFNKLNKITNRFALLVLLTTLLSLIPGVTYVVSYPLINGFSLLSLIYIMGIAIYIQRKTGKLNPLFVIGIGVLILGALLFILGNFSVINQPAITQVALKWGTLIEIICLSILMAGKYKTLQEEKEQAQKKLVDELEGINEKLEAQVAERTAEIQEQKAELEEKNSDIMASIKYAERIQRAILPSKAKFMSLLPNSFVLFKPRDIVSGDFYWLEELNTSKGNKNNLIVYATADCTGHGVPGAFVSIVGDSFLSLSKTEKTVNTTGEALDFLNAGIYKTFNSQFSEQTIRDGMDIALCAIDFENMLLSFSGAKNPVYIVRKGELHELKGDKRPIGFIDENDTEKFITQHFNLEKDDVIYTFSDGYADQFGGPRGKKFMYKRMKDILLHNYMLPMEKQKELLEEAFLAWKGAEEQLDDVLLIGVRV